LQDSQAAKAGNRDYTVLGLNTQVRNLLDMAFPYPVWLRGEVTATPRPNSKGHMYFQLIDPSADGGQPEASLDCVLFAGSRTQVVRDFAREGIVFQLEKGMAVRLLGKVDVWPPGGRYQFVVQSVDPVWTRGEQALQLRRLLEKLTETGALDENSTLPIPPVPLRIGLVTAENSAACSDFLRTLDESGFPFVVYTSWASMQGSNTSSSVVKAFNALLKAGDLDVAVLTRGGGSPTDLNWFNDEAIAITISQLPWPVISGIGHETDTTLPDYAAHTRAKTPTHAASVLVDMVADFAEDVGSLSALLVRGAVPSLRLAGERLGGLARRLADETRSGLRGASSVIDSRVSKLGLHSDGRLRSAETILRSVTGRISAAAVLSGLRARRAGVESLAGALAAAASGRLGSLELGLEKLSAQVERRDPEKMLGLGWALVRKGKQDGILTSVESVEPSEEIDVTLKDGSLSARVTEVRGKEGVTSD
jgi:exodeoxyribonuclease VII large subunit